MEKQRATSTVAASAFIFLKGLFDVENQEQDLTVGSVPQKLIRFALPLFGANLLQSFYSIVDMLVVGRIVGKAGLAAISNASMISFIINSICIGVTMGGTVLVAQCKGANDEQGQKETVGTLFSLSCVMPFWTLCLCVCLSAGCWHSPFKSVSLEFI